MLDLALHASRRLPFRHVFSDRFPEVVMSCATWVRRSLQSKTLQLLIIGKLSGVDPSRPENLQRIEVELTR